jgi:hypothetical protein
MCSKRILLIHIPKNSGTYIRKNSSAMPPSIYFLKDEFRQKEIWYRDKRFLGLFKHVPASQVRDDMWGIFTHKVAVVRNPWSRLVSLYEDVSRINKIFEGTSYALNYELTFDQFLDRMDQYSHDSNFYYNHPYNHFANQVDWIYRDGKISTDVIRFENITDDFWDYSNCIGAPQNVGTYESDYKTYYSEKQIQKVADFFSLDIEYWGFDFESGANKNYWRKVNNDGREQHGCAEDHLEENTKE